MKANLLATAVWAWPAVAGAVDAAFVVAVDFAYLSGLGRNWMRMYAERKGREETYNDVMLLRRRRGRKRVSGEGEGQSEGHTPQPNLVPSLWGKSV